VLVTHYHPDHIGLAGWLCERFALPLLMSQTEYLVSLSIHLEPARSMPNPTAASIARTASTARPPSGCSPVATATCA
jgi:glyoxylase-like metal-dependent hydrolase (beta-lactamase superfamily II)